MLAHAFKNRTACEADASVSNGCAVRKGQAVRLRSAWVSLALTSLVQGVCTNGDRYPRMTLFIMGFYFPYFYLQLDAVRHDVDETFAFYAVRSLNPISFLAERVLTGMV